MLLSLAACTTPVSEARLSQTEVRRIADARARQSTGSDLRKYEVSGPRLVPGEDYWSVVYYLKTNKRVAFTVRVHDKEKKTSVIDSEGRIFEGALVPKTDFH